VIGGDGVDVVQRHVHRDPGVVDQPVQTAPPLLSRCDQSSGSTRVADVALDVHRVRQLSGDALARFGRRCRVDDNPGAEAGKAAGDRRADTA